MLDCDIFIPFGVAFLLPLHLVMKIIDDHGKVPSTYILSWIACRAPEPYPEVSNCRRVHVEAITISLILATPLWTGFTPITVVGHPTHNH